MLKNEFVTKGAMFSHKNGSLKVVLQRIFARKNDANLLVTSVEGINFRSYRSDFWG